MAEGTNEEKISENIIKLDEKHFYEYKEVAEKCKNIKVLKINHIEDWAKESVLKEFVNRAYEDEFCQTAKISSCRIIYVASAKRIHWYTYEVYRKNNFINVYDGYDSENDRYLGHIESLGPDHYTDKTVHWDCFDLFPGYTISKNLKSKEISKDVPTAPVYIKRGLDELNLLIIEPMYEMCVEFQGIKYYQYVSAFNGKIYTSGPLQVKAEKKIKRSINSKKRTEKFKTPISKLIRFVPLITLIALNVFYWGSDFVATNKLVWATKNDWIMPIIEDSNSVFFTPTILMIVAFVWACLKLIFNLLPWVFVLLWTWLIVEECYTDTYLKFEGDKHDIKFICGDSKTMAKYYKGLKAKLIIKNLVWILLTLGVVFLEYLFLKWIMFNLYI